MSDDIYNVSKYTDNELYDILDLANPTDRELEAKILNMIWKYNNMGNSSGDKLVNFFKDIYDHFFETSEEEEDVVEGFEPINISDKLTKAKIDKTKEEPTDIPEEENMTETNRPTGYTFQIDYSKDKLNPLLKQTTKRIVSLDSQYRENQSAISTDYTFNLSDPLKDVVSLKLYSIQIPYTWYTISKNFGSNFFYIKGNSSGINNGNHDYQVSIKTGNYTATELIAAVNTAITELKTNPLYTDISFGDTSITYDYFSSKATLNIDIQKQFDEYYYSMAFQTWTTPIPTNINDRNKSIPSFLGYNEQIYYPYRIYSNLSTLTLTTDVSGEEINTNPYTLTPNNNYLTIIQYLGNSPSIEYISDSNSSYTVLDTITVTLSRLNINNKYSRNAIVSELNHQLQNNTKLLSISKIARVDVTDASYIGYGFSHYELDIRLNRYTTQNVANSKVAVIFPIDNLDNIWTGGSSVFVFDKDKYELSSIISETTNVQTNFIIRSNPQIVLKCIKPYYGYDSNLNIQDISLNDYIIDVSNSSSVGYLLPEYLDAINYGITQTNNSTKSSDNPLGDFKTSIMKVTTDNALSKFNMNVDLTKTFTQKQYNMNLAGTILNTILNFPDTLIDLSQNVFTSSFLIAGGGYTILSTDTIMKIQPKSTEKNKYIPNYIVYPETTISKTYTNIAELQGGINNAFNLFRDIDGTPVLQGTNVVITQNGDIANVILTVVVRKYLSETDYRVYFIDPSANSDWVEASWNIVDPSWNITDSSNSWAYNFKLANRSYLITDVSQINVNNEYYSVIEGTQTVAGGIITLDSTNNKIYLSPVDATNGGEGIASGTGSNTITITIPPATYTRDTLLFTMNNLFTTTTSTNDGPLANGSVSSIYTVNTKTFTKIRLNINKTYTSSDYRVVFYDPYSFVKCYIGVKSVRNTTWDSTLGWILGYRDSTEYDLSTIQSTSTTNTNLKSLTGETVVSVNLYNYFMIVLDDYNQNHLNDGLITTTQRENDIPLPSYTNRATYRCDPTTGKVITSTITSKGDNNLTQNQIYAAQEIINLQKSQQTNSTTITNSITTKTQYYSSGPFAKDVFALLPLKTAQLPNNVYYVDYGGTLQNQERTYFGPVNIHRMTVKLINDRGETVDLNGANWSFSLICEQLYQQNKT